MTRDEAVAILRSPEGRDETRRVYHLRRAFELVVQTIYAGDYTRSEAEQLVAGLADLAEEFFPGSAETFSIIYGRRLALLCQILAARSIIGAGIRPRNRLTGNALQRSQ
jgi:hypothetical protein